MIGGKGGRTLAIPTREELLHAYDTLTEFVAKESTPEAIAEGKRAKNELMVVLDKLNKVMFRLEGVLRNRGIAPRDVPYWVDQRRGRPRLCFLCWDGKKLTGAPNGERPQPVGSLPIAHRTAIANEARFLV